MKIAIVKGGFFLTAELGGGDKTSFRRPVSDGPAAWETFTVTDDKKSLRCADGIHYLTISTIGWEATRTLGQIASWEKFLPNPIVAGTWFSEDRTTSIVVDQVVVVEGEPVSTLDSLGVTGVTFSNDWQYQGATDFRILKRIFDGEDVSGVLQQRKAAGANILRTLTMAGNLFPLDPDNYSDADLKAAIALVNSNGLRLELVALADCAQPLTKPLAWQQNHLARIGSVAGMVNLVELGNEINYFYQNVDPMQFTKPAGCLSSRGSVTGYGNFAQLPAAPNAWDYSTIHGDRDEKWLQNIAKAGLDLVHGFTGYAGTQGPVVHNEPTKQPYPRTTPDDWYIAGVQGSVWRKDGIGGILFHCDASLQSLLWNDSDLNCAKSLYKGMDAVSKG